MLLGNGTVSEKDWTLKQQDMLQVEGRTYDAYEVVLADGIPEAAAF